jgi:succinyl-diaminopimelate desuccinylase
MRLLDEIERRRDDLVDLTRALVRIPSVNPPGDGYREICDFLANRLRRSGFAIELVRGENTPGDSDRFPRWNVVARREGPASGECVHFNSHTDVVLPGQGWTFDPFGAEIQDGRIYGRGTCDMKGGLAASIIAAEAFIDTTPDFTGAVEISGTADEETGGFGGVAYLAQKGYFSPERVQHVIIPEPLNKDRICLGHRGVWWAEIETRGRIAHGSMPFLGDSAIRHMGAVLAEIEENLYPALERKKHTAMPVVPSQARQSTLNINSMHGGLPEPEGGFSGFPSPVVADSARIVIDRRYLIEESDTEVRQEFVELLERVKARRPSFRYELREMWSVSPTLTDREAPVVRAVAESVRQVFGRDPDYVVSPGTYDQKHIDRIGKLRNCIAYGPGILDLAHQPDEWVGIADMEESAKVMALTLLQLLGPRRAR